MKSFLFSWLLLFTLLIAQHAEAQCPNLKVYKDRKVQLNEAELCEVSQRLYNEFGLQVVVNMVLRNFKTEDRWFAYLDSIEPKLLTADGKAARLPDGNYYDNVVVISIAEFNYSTARASIAYGQIIGDLEMVPALKTIKNKAQNDLNNRPSKEIGKNTEIVTLILKHMYVEMKKHTASLLEKQQAAARWEAEKQQLEAQRRELLKNRIYLVLSIVTLAGIFVILFVLRKTIKKRQANKTAALAHKQKMDALWQATSIITVALDPLIGGNNKEASGLYQLWEQYCGPHQPAHPKVLQLIETAQERYTTAFKVHNQLAETYLSGFHLISPNDLVLLEQLYTALVGRVRITEEELSGLRQTIVSPVHPHALLSQINDAIQNICDPSLYQLPITHKPDPALLSAQGLVSLVNSIKAEIGLQINLVTQVTTLQQELEKGLPLFVARYQGVGIVGFEPEAVSTFINKTLADATRLFNEHQYTFCENYFAALKKMFLEGVWIAAFSSTAEKLTQAATIQAQGIKYRNAQGQIDMVYQYRTKALAELSYAQHPQLVLSALENMEQTADKALQIMLERQRIQNTFIAHWVEAEALITNTETWNKENLAELNKRASNYPPAEKQYILLPLLDMPSREAALEKLSHAKTLFRHEEQYYEEAWEALNSLLEMHKSGGPLRQAWTLLEGLVKEQKDCSDALANAVAEANTASSLYKGVEVVLMVMKVQQQIDHVKNLIDKKEIFEAKRQLPSVTKAVQNLLEEAKDQQKQGSQSAWGGSASQGGTSYSSSSSSSSSSTSSSSRSSSSSSSGRSSKGSTSSSGGSSSSSRGYSGGGRSSSGSSGGGRSSSSSGGRSSGGSSGGGGGYKGGGRV